MRIINIKPVLRICIFQTPVKEANNERLAPVDVGLASRLLSENTIQADFV